MNDRRTGHCAMPQLQETILERLGKALHVDMDDITREPLPRRWVELIHYLDEDEQKRAHGRQTDKDLRGK
jgi:hypothetical protein